MKTLEKSAFIRENSLIQDTLILLSIGPPSTCFAISVEDNSEHCKNDLNDCMDDTEDAAADFSPVLSPGRKRNYTPNVDGFSKKDTAQVTAQTSTLILELPTRIPAPIPPPNSPSLMMNRHQFQNSTISATDENKYKKSRVFLFCNVNSLFKIRLHQLSFFTMQFRRRRMLREHQQYE